MEGTAEQMAATTVTDADTNGAPISGEATIPKVASTTTSGASDDTVGISSPFPHAKTVSKYLPLRGGQCFIMEWFGHI